MKKLLLLSALVLIAVICITKIDIQINFGKETKTIINKTESQTPLMEFNAKPVALKSAGESNIQVALLLDTSNSMDGLIDQAKSQLWKMVNELALAKDQEGNIPNLQIALYEYGNDNLSSRDGYIRQIAPMTTDLDLVSEKLFAMTTYGGEEYCGHVIQTATKDLQWSDSNKDLKIIFIAGNEPFTQGNVDYKKSCKAAIEQGIIVNTIYCGDYEEGISTQWKDGADLADGKYIHINQNEAVVHIETPYDKEIGELNNKLNDTYIGYGSKGKAKKKRQSIQDSNASSYGSSNAAQRVVSKSSAAYKNSDWDLVDAVEESAVEVEELEEDALPEEMKKMDKDERKGFIETKAKERKEVQAKIQELSKKRREYETAERAKTATEGESTLDDAMIGTIREQAKTKSYKFKE
ncbi:MAG: vWA domain-containing protein [Chitinophagales bacterium]